MNILHFTVTIFLRFELYLLQYFTHKELLHLRHHLDAEQTIFVKRTSPLVVVNAKYQNTPDAS